VSAENKQNENGGAGQESLVESFNKHYTDYLERYSTNKRAVQVENVEGVAGGESTVPVDEDLFFSPEVDEQLVSSESSDVPVTPVSVETASETDEVLPVSVEVEDYAGTVSPVDESVTDETPAAEHDHEGEEENSSLYEGSGQGFADLEDEEDEGSPLNSASFIEDDEDEYYSPESNGGFTFEDEDQDDLGFYEPEQQPAAPEPAQQQVEQPQPQQTVVEREVLREVLVVDREQARDLGYGADRYINEQPAPARPAPVSPTTPVKPAVNSYQASPAPVRTERSVERSVDVRGEGTSQTFYPEERQVQIRPAEKSSGFFGGLFKRKDSSEGSDVSAYVSDVSDYKERSRIREEGITADFGSAGDDSNVISLKTQDNYDPREERRRLQHVSSEQRDVDPAGWLEQTMLDALKMDASDLHIVVDGETKDLRARIRVDGQMQDFDYVTGVPAKVIMGRLKAATKLSSGGSFAPEETIYSIDLDGESRKARAVLFRVEDGGEALVMRLPLTGNLRQLDELAFSDQNLQHVLDLLAMPYKLIMIAGPMGSGKTTTAHGALLHVADPTRTVWTIEDPVERRLPNLVQLEIDEENGAGFDVLLSKLLRADYNTLFLGEIRDNATASAAVRQAKAGRQVMSTIHADDNIKSLMRLIELAGDSPMSVLSAVGGVISQRLVRKLNPEWDGVDMTKKYKGRVPIHEILFVNDSIVEVMMQDRPLSEIKQQVRAAKGSTFYDDAVRLINAGVTDREEVVKVIGEFDAEDR
jgi:type II secretory ATPase GspE/PulE/Tfp pilus assembly ATPase PilB-like protein